MAEVISLQNISDDDKRHRDKTISKLTVNFSDTQEVSKFQSKMHRRVSRFSFTAPVFLQYKHISFSVSQGRNKERKYILDDINGKINVGELTGILGPSGSGKTSLMNILSGYKDFVSNKKEAITGKILINGRNRNAQQFRMISSYVTQDDHLFPHFTVKETMMMAANLKISEIIILDEKLQMIKEILQKLGLWECQNTKVINLSGGERKRLCISLEIIGDPLNLFLDEPTSGLDSTSAAQCISLLKSLARTGRTVVCTIHQPSSKLLENFDKLIFLADGKCVYEGMTNDLIPHFSSLNFHCPTHYNPADFVLDVINQKKRGQITTLVRAVKKKKVNILQERHDLMGIDVDDPKENVLNIEYMTSNWTQFKILFTREILFSCRNKWALKIPLAFHVFIGILFGLLYYGTGNQGSTVLNNIAGIHSSQIFLMYSAAVLTIIQFPMARRIILREQVNTWYSLKNYYFSKILAELPFQIIFSVLFSTIYYWLTFQPSELFRFFYFVAFCVLTAMTSSALGLMFGAGASIQEAICLLVVFSVPIVGFTGLLIRYRAMPNSLRWIASTSYTAYAFEGILITIYGFSRDNLECMNGVCFFSSPTLLFDELGIVNRKLYTDFLGIIICFFLFRIVSYFILRWKLKV